MSAPSADDEAAGRLAAMLGKTSGRGEAAERLASMLGHRPNGDVSELERPQAATAPVPQMSDRQRTDLLVSAAEGREARAYAERSRATEWARTIADGLAEGEKVRVGDVLDARPDDVPVLALIEAFNDLLAIKQIHREGHAELAVFVGRKR